MWPWRKRYEEEPTWKGAARAGLAGATREELMREVLHSLSRDGRADRIGVWLEQDSFVCSDPLAVTCLRGLLWESGGDEAPEEWEKLSLEPPLPQELLACGKSVYQQLEDAHGQL